MLRGFYTAGSGLVTYENRLNVHANNLANVSTVGFKRDELITGTFGEHMSTRMNRYQGNQPEEIGPGVFITTTVDEYTDHAQGGFDATERPFDIAIQGQGFFLLRTEQGELLTRNGQFALDDEGYLVLPGYGRVQGEDGDIEIGSSFFKVDPDGVIYLDPEEEDDEPEELTRILLVQPTADAEVKKTHNNEFFTTDAYAFVEPDGGEIMLRQGVLERSNVDVASEMTRIIATQRGFQSCSQIVKMYDSMAEQANTRIAKV